MEIYAMSTEIVGSYHNKTKKEVNEFIQSLPEYTYTHQFKDILTVYEKDNITFVNLDLTDKTKRPFSLYQIISISRELTQLQ